MPAETQVDDLKHGRSLNGLVTRGERIALGVLVDRLPSWVLPNHLTIMGVAGAFLTFGCLVASHISMLYLWGALAGLALNWFGDSLDGTLARSRKIERPRFGFYVDHVSDLASQLLIVVGLGLSPLMSLDIALLGLVGYLGLSVLSFVKLHVSRQLQLSFLGVGPTEIRLLIGAGLTLAVIAPLPTLALGFAEVRLFDAFGLLIFAACCGVAIATFMADAARLSQVDPPRHSLPAAVVLKETSR